MNFKSLAVITVLVLGCSFASAQSYTFGLDDVGGEGYCNYLQFSQVKPYAIWEGVDNLTGGCGASYNATMVGVSAKLTATGNPAGFALKGVAFADNIYDAFSLSYTGAQLFIVTGLECGYKKYGWINFVSMSGIWFGGNYGWLSCTIPGRNGVVATAGPTIGNIRPRSKK